MASSHSIFKRQDNTKRSRDSLVGIAAGHGVGKRGSEFECLYVQEFSLLRVVQTCSGAHPASYPMGTGGFSCGVKRPGREADNSSSN
jgi:hypothetical protein